MLNRDEVIAEARKRYGKPICLDEIEDALLCETLEEAVSVLLIDSAYWDGQADPPIDEESDDLSELLEEFCDKKRLYCFEGDRGIEKFEQIVSQLGYEPNGFKYGSLVEVFLADNPGAIQALVEWIGSINSPEWVESIKSALKQSDE